MIGARSGFAKRVIKLASGATRCNGREQRSGGVRNMTRCIYCSLNGKDESHWLSRCRDFLQLNPKDRRDVVIKSGKCLNCLRDHLVKDCTFRNNCRKCENECGERI